MKHKIIFFGGFKKFSEIYFNALKDAGFEIVSEAKDADLGVIAYFGKIIPKDILELPKNGYFSRRQNHRHNYTFGDGGAGCRPNFNPKRNSDRARGHLFEPNR